MPTILTGNESVKEPLAGQGPDASGLVPTQDRADLGAQVHTIFIPPTTRVETKHGFQLEWPVHEQLATLTRFIENSHGEPPSWVEGDDDALVAAVASQYGCPVGRPKGWQPGKGMKGVKRG